MSRTELQENLLWIADVYQKLSLATPHIEAALNRRLFRVPDLPPRDVQILPPKKHPDKAGLSSVAGQARLLHDLASIELQAFELGLRTLIEFPSAPEFFRGELAELTKSEANHLRLCLEAIEQLGYKWGSFPVHQLLWSATSAEDSLLDRVFIVHRYLEGSGLDAGETLLGRLEGVHLKSSLPLIVNQIVKEEVDHVEFGSRWYAFLCEKEGLQRDRDFEMRFLKLKQKLPKRVEKISSRLRKQAGFTDAEICFLQNHRQSIVKYS